jgi:hypothetical protein
MAETFNTRQQTVFNFIQGIDNFHGKEQPHLLVFGIWNLVHLIVMTLDISGIFFKYAPFFV